MICCHALGRIYRNNVSKLTESISSLRWSCTPTSFRKWNDGALPMLADNPCVSARHKEGADKYAPVSAQLILRTSMGLILKPSRLFLVFQSKAALRKSALLESTCYTIGFFSSCCHMARCEPKECARRKTWSEQLHFLQLRCCPQR